MVVQYILALAGILLFAGCGTLDTFFFGPPAPPPKAKWQPAPGFSPNSVTKIAVFVDEQSRRSRNSSTPLERTIEDLFIIQLLQNGYHVAARTDIDQVMKELKFQQSGMTEADAARLGKMVNASAVLIVTINSTVKTDRRPDYVDYTATCNMGARLISTEKGEVLGISSLSCYKTETTSPDAVISNTASIAAQAIADSIPSRNSQ
jgi:hypothetical protein